MVGIADPIPAELKRILDMAEYSGVLRKQGTISKGERGVYTRYTLHSAIVLKEHSLSLGQSFPLRDAIASLTMSSSHAFARARAGNLLGPDFLARCTLDLAPCKKCGTPRLSEDARFCVKCGNELVSSSIYEELVNTSIENLPLTKKKIEGLRAYTSIRTIHDILIDDEFTEIRKVPQVGPIWTARIRNAAQEYVSV